MQQLDSTTRRELEMMYGVLLPAVNVANDTDPLLHNSLRSTVVQLARVLGKECPVPTRRNAAVQPQSITNKP